MAYILKIDRDEICRDFCEQPFVDKDEYIKAKLKVMEEELKVVIGDSYRIEKNYRV
jgi:hypothetical protein